MSRLYHAPAVGPNAVTMTNFLAAFAPKPEPLDELLGKLFTAAKAGDRQACAELRAEIKAHAEQRKSEAATPPELRRENRHLWDGERNAA